LEQMLSLERIGCVAVATLSRPPVNALNGEILDRLVAVLDEVVADEEVSVLHIRSNQKAFCAGADLALMRSCFATPEGTDVMVEVVRRMQRVFERIEAAPLVTLAEIGGAALGGGLELALACDLRVAALEATLGLPEVRLGLVPGAGGTQRLTRLCGRGIASRLILGGEVIDGALAERLGIVQWAQPRKQLAEWTGELAARFSAAPRAALAANKRCMAAADSLGREGYEQELASSRRLYDHPETRRRVSEFLSRKATETPAREV
jgi:enoyl-CoA hydratase